MFILLLLNDVQIPIDLNIIEADEIVEENQYYPFGLKHANYNMSRKAYYKSGGDLVLEEPCPSCPIDFKYNYKYNGKEYQDELGLNFYDYGARNYDPALGRWMNIDPLAEEGRRWSPYNYAMDNPVYFVDPDGMLSQSFIDKMMNSESGTTWINNNDGTFSNNNDDKINTRLTKDDLDKGDYRYFRNH